MKKLFCILRKDEWRAEAAIATDTMLLHHYIVAETAGLALQDPGADDGKAELLPSWDALISRLMQDLENAVVYTFDGRQLSAAIRSHAKGSTVRIADLRPMISSMKKRDVQTSRMALDLMEFEYDRGMYGKERSQVLADLRAAAILCGNLASQGRLPALPGRGPKEYPLGKLRLIFALGLLMCIILAAANLLNGQ
ncbi:MAG: hypothetical protein IJ523_10245 [Succinivibrionaceae bacterium]|nr:hypothetical protein [Succinivibrionaceae bacterium]